MIFVTRTCTEHGPVTADNALCPGCARAEIAEVIRERDAARTEVERLRAACEPIAVGFRAWLETVPKGLDPEGVFIWAHNSNARDGSGNERISRGDAERLLDALESK